MAVSESPVMAPGAIDLLLAVNGCVRKSHIPGRW